ncbi:Gfo/Idh/MocA family protein [Kineococcus gynurae]|uniref:Gfo/Idh/MocA family protein n=1 Tax=Kineococcus gynurae TaxID=452979 RepID=A0ABV5LPB7_9ACTN
MSNPSDLRVGVVGAGLMGGEHVRRLAGSIPGACVGAVVEPDADRAGAAAAAAGGVATFARIEDALAAGALDAVVIATPGPFHEQTLLPVLEAGLPVLCEKPLTPDPESSWRILQAEQATGRRLIQVGFMRRFDDQYARLRELVAAGGAGELLMLRGVHRNPAVPETYTQSMLITDSVVHEFDVLPWVAGRDIVSVEVVHARRNELSPGHLSEPVLVLMRLADDILVDVEMNVSVGFGYQVATEAVFQQGIARIGQPEGLQLWQRGTFSLAEHQSFATRFSAAYDTQLRAFVEAARAGTVTGPSAWDGYKVAVACAAGVVALDRPGPVALDLPPVPSFYA